MHFAMICCLSNHDAKIHIFFDTDVFLDFFYGIVSIGILIW